MSGNICIWNHRDCAALRGDRCGALIDTHFRKKDCPFYKSKAQNEAEKLVCAQRLADMDLAELYDCYPKELCDEC